MSEQSPRPELRMAVDDSVARIEISNPARLNALTAAMWAAVPDMIARAERDESVRVIVIRGDGDRAFSAGADISEFETSRQGAEAAHYNDLNHRAFDAIQDCSKPTIALIHGFCLGGGLAIAACCDLRLAGDRALFAIPAARLGIGYDPRWLKPLLRLASPAHVKEILFTGRRFNVAEALAMGIVNRVVPAAELGAAVDVLAAEIAGNAPLTLRAAKRAIDALSRQPESADMAALDDLVAACFASDDYAEGRRAFMEKRPPQFKGR